MTNLERARRLCAELGWCELVLHDADCEDCDIIERALDQVAAEARQAEREACADLVSARGDVVSEYGGDYSPRSELARAAVAIRNRGGE